MKTFSKILVELRSTKKLNQGELAQMLGVSQQTVSHWEAGKRQPKLKHAMKLCDTFNMDIEEIIKCFSSRNPA